jgi:hypothetical protein
MYYDEICEAFDSLNPSDKAMFIDSRLGWATGGALCGEVHIRICDPLCDESESSNRLTI